MVESVDGNEAVAAVCRKMSKSISTFVEVAGNPCGGRRSPNRIGSRNLGRSKNSPPRTMGGQAARSQCVELCSIDIGVALATLRLPINCLRGLLPTTSLRRARRNNSIKQTAAPQKLANATYNIQLSI